MAKKNYRGNVVSTVWPLAESIAKEFGFDLWDVRFVKEGGNFYLRIFIDNKEGVTIEDCENISRALDAPLDELDPISQNYCLEVCSPGLERELIKDEHFNKFMGKDIFARLIRPTQTGEKEIRGTLHSFNKDEICIKKGNEIILLKRKDTAFIKLDDFNM